MGRRGNKEKVWRLTDEQRDLAGRNLGLATKAAVRFKRGVPPFVGLDELEAAAGVGLMQAAMRFDPARGVLFATYCQGRMLGAMLDYVRTRGYVPHRTVQKNAAKGRVLPRFNNLNIGEKRMGDRFDEPSRQRGEAPGGLQLADERAGDAVAAVDERDQFAKYMAGLNRLERLVMTLYYCDGLTMRECGRAAGFSESRCSQVITQAKAFIKSELTAVAASN